jgi:hypothetical protein
VLYLVVLVELVIDETLDLRRYRSIHARIDEVRYLDVVGEDDLLERGHIGVGELIESGVDGVMKVDRVERESRYRYQRFWRTNPALRITEPTSG